MAVKTPSTMPKEQGDKARDQRQFQRRWQTFCDDIHHRTALTVRYAKVALYDRIAEEFDVLHGKGLIEPKLRAKTINVFLCAFLSQHIVDGIADKIEHGKGHKAHN